MGRKMSSGGVIKGVTSSVVNHVIKFYALRVLFETLAMKVLKRFQIVRIGNVSFVTRSL